MENISLSSGMRSNLLSLQETNKLLNRTQERLSSGRKINSAIDGPSAYFSALTLNDRAESLDNRLDGIGQAIQTIRASETGLNSIRSMLGQARAIAEDAGDQSSATERRSLGQQFNEVLRQIQTMAADSAYLGTNLIQRADPSDPTAEDQEMIIQFSERINESTLVITGFNIYGPVSSLDANGEVDRALTLSSAAGSFTSLSVQSYGQSGDAHEVDWGDANFRTILRNVISSIEQFDDQLKIESTALANEISIISLREEFTKNIINEFEAGADRLTIADLNEEGANLLALQTSQQLGVSSLSLASQARQSVLRLLG